MGVVLKDGNKESIAFPAEVGRFAVISKDYSDKDKAEIVVDLIPCTESLGHLNEPLLEQQIDQLSGAICIP